jgi:two-component SAPR family response regulator
MVTVLIIDNDLGFMFWLGQILNEAGYLVLPAGAVSEAVDLMSENKIEADLLIIKPSLPGVISLVAELRLSRSGLKVIASTEMEGQTYDSSGIDYSLVKPVGADEALRQTWLQTIRELLPMDSATQ